MSDPTSLTACVCTYKRYDILGDCLTALLKQKLRNVKYEILVVDNSPNKDDAIAFKDKFESTPINFTWTSTAGLSNARNIGAQQCGTEIIAFIDDDAICGDDWAHHLLDVYKKFGSSCGVVGGSSYPIWQGKEPEWFPKNRK